MDEEVRVGLADGGSLAKALTQNHADLVADQLRKLAGYRDALLVANQTTNLTAIRDLIGIERRLILESLRLVPPLDERLAEFASARPRLIDIGTGAGIPGIVLAIARPNLDVTLLDATRKKIAFLERTIAELDLGNARAVHGRAEEIGLDRTMRGRFDIATARAVSSIPSLMELGLPLLKRGGYLLLSKGPDIDEELEAGVRAGEILGGTVMEASFLPEAGTSIATQLVIVEKTAPTPGAYPRRSGIPSRNPLGTHSRISRPVNPDRGGDG
ncbi:MAG: 16S rRNA (guanine(527)-N(7))-methyltransferase [uncultured Thermomicrobiales bacterium]|uniref:Ribosomal RNA small subunit methyltransferase G n=1 Tax=uncultured Thermomicrobiales bacterium TaxID=1645740 RepID=A0A6J4U436_9BACT|nr:MAG: 16S rRNA (guanine(527)-N(7))-methyltransferase [uncultured Thermomicrobiales bacterium]